MSTTIEHKTIRPPVSKEEERQWRYHLDAFLRSPNFPGDVDVGGNLVVTGDTTSSAFILSSPRWTDLRFPVQNLVKNPATSKPDFDFAEVEYLFDDSSTETVAGAGLMDHGWEKGSQALPHIHWTQKAAGVVAWQLEYKFWDPGELEPGFTTITTEDQVFAYVSGDLGQISEFPAIETAGLKVGFNIKFKLSRLGGDGADTMVGDAAFNEFDFHYQTDTPGGSEFEFAK